MNTISHILQRASDGKCPSRAELLELLSLPEDSVAALALRECANAISRKRFGNKALVLGQVGIENKPCPAICKFCAFSKEINTCDETLSLDVITQKAVEMTGSGRLYALFIMGMHDFSRDYLLEVCRHLHKTLPDVRLVVNIGDCPRDYLQALKAEGVMGAYHVCRLREGVDTALNPADRIATIEAIRAAGLQWFTCCEPIGSEHTNEELLEQLLIGNTYQCFQHATMARVNIEGSALAQYPEISKRRLAQITAVVALAGLDNPELRSIAVHEPDVLSLNAGANSLYAESGANPRDKEAETSLHRGRDVNGVTAMLKEAGYEV